MSYTFWERRGKNRDQDRQRHTERNREIDRNRQRFKFEFTYERKQGICLSQLISHNRWPVVPSFFLQLIKFQPPLWLNCFLMCIELAFEKGLFSGKENIENYQFQMDHQAWIRWSSIGPLLEELSWRTVLWLLRLTVTQWELLLTFQLS